MLIFSERGGATYSPAPFMKNYVRVLYRQPPHLSHPTPVTFSGQQLQFAALGEQSDWFVWSCHLYNRKDQDNQDKYRSIIIKINHAKQDYRMCHLRSSIQWACSAMQGYPIPAQHYPQTASLTSSASWTSWPCFKCCIDHTFFVIMQNSFWICFFFKWPLPVPMSPSIMCWELSLFASGVLIVIVPPLKFLLSMLESSHLSKLRVT